MFYVQETFFLFDVALRRVYTLVYWKYMYVYFTYVLICTSI